MYQLKFLCHDRIRKGDANRQHKQSLSCKNIYRCIIWEFWKKITIVYFSFISSLTICIILFWINSERIVFLDLRRNCTSSSKIRLKIIVIVIFSVMETLASAEQGESIKSLPTYLSGSFRSPRCCFKIVSSVDVVSISTAESPKFLPVETSASTRTLLTSSNDIVWQFDVGFRWNRSTGVMELWIMISSGNPLTRTQRPHIYTYTAQIPSSVAGRQSTWSVWKCCRLDKYIYLCIDIEFQWHHFLSTKQRQQKPTRSSAEHYPCTHTHPLPEQTQNKKPRTVQGVQSKHVEYYNTLRHCASKFRYQKLILEQIHHKELDISQ